jgi:hypothetical protein
MTTKTTTAARLLQLSAVAADPTPTVRVDMAAHLAAIAAELVAAVAAVDAMTPHQRRKHAAALGRRFAALRPAVNLAARPTSLTLPGNGNRKTAKNQLPTITYTGSPSTSGRVTLDTISGPVRLIFNNCPHSGKCSRVCVLTGGNARYNSVANGRRWRDLVSYTDPVGWIQLLRAEIIAAADRGNGRGVLVRSDVGTELGLARLVPALFADTPSGSRVRGYDYAKSPAAMRGDGFTADRNHRTAYSWNERSDARTVNRFLHRGGSVVVVAAIRKADPIPDAWRIGRQWWPTIDGDATDDRYHDAAGAVVLVRAKGKAAQARHAARLGGFVMPSQLPA